jgi:hypothetical protein
MTLAMRHAAGVIVLWCRPEHEEASSRKVTRGNCGHWMSQSVKMNSHMEQAAQSILRIFHDNIALAFVDRLTKSMRGTANSTLQDELNIREMIGGMEELNVQVRVRSLCLHQSLHFTGPCTADTPPNSTSYSFRNTGAFATLPHTPFSPHEIRTCVTNTHRNHDYYHYLYF